MRITDELLTKHEACRNERLYFQAKWPEGTEVSGELLVWAGSGRRYWAFNESGLIPRRLQRAAVNALKAAGWALKTGELEMGDYPLDAYYRHGKRSDIDYVPPMLDTEEHQRAFWEVVAKAINEAQDQYERERRMLREPKEVSDGVTA